ncbi:hypothetical protein ABTX77_19050 [Streptomyces sp. NPDC097704]|uniref:hypothetical protein n=1 Tax=Streptomyces sp. NPDC097704 TaxID=3157101 RepID=UPI0033233332
MTTRRTSDGMAEPEKAAGTHLTLGPIPMPYWEVYDIQGVRMSVNHGANKVRFPAPVPVGSRVRAGVELLGATPGAGGHQVVTRITIERDGGDEPVCAADTVTVVVP